MKPRKDGQRFDELMNQLEDYLRYTSGALERNAPKGSEKIVKEMQTMIENLINGDMQEAVKWSKRAPKSTRTEMDYRVDQLRAVELVGAMKDFLRETENKEKKTKGAL